MSPTDRPSLSESFSEILQAPWIAWQAFRAIIMGPLNRFILRLNGLDLGPGSLLYGRPIIQRYRGSQIVVGRDFESRNYPAANAVGCSHPLILATRSSEAKISIGDNVGITGGVICAAVSVAIGDDCLIGADVLIVDTDFHPVEPENRRHRRAGVRTAPVVIGKNVFIGARSIVLKGVYIGENSVIGAGSVVAQSVPANVVVTGNPSRIVRRIEPNEQ